MSYNNEFEHTKFFERLSKFAIKNNMIKEGQILSTLAQEPGPYEWTIDEVHDKKEITYFITLFYRNKAKTLDLYTRSIKNGYKYLNFDEILNQNE